MNKVFVGAVAIAPLIIGAPAHAADMYVKAPLLPPPACIWCGWYVGVNIGGAVASADDTLVGTNILSPVALQVVTSERPVSVIGGVHAGFNWQWRALIVGLEADIDAAGFKDTGNGPVTLIAGPALGLVAGQSFSAMDEVHSFGTARVRLGLPYGNWLPYVTGGFAWQQVSSTETFVGGPPASATLVTAQVLSNSAVRTGWAAGVGVESGPITGHWTLRAEYLHIDTGTWNNSFGPAPTTIATGGPFMIRQGTVLNESTRLTNDVFRVGVSYYFGH